MNVYLSHVWKDICIGFYENIWHKPLSSKLTDIFPRKVHLSGFICLEYVWTGFCHNFTIYWSHQYNNASKHVTSSVPSLNYWSQ